MTPLSVDTDPHPAFRVYSAGNFGEVAPERLSPMSWSLVGDPMERATRRLATRLWGRASWISGSHYVFVGYFGCRPYHNLSAYCHLADALPGLAPADVAAAYFEDTPPPPAVLARVPATRRALAAVRLLRELGDIGPELAGLEDRVAALEGKARGAIATGNPIARYDVLKEARALLDDAWGAHVMTTAGLVPLRVTQYRMYRRLVRFPREYQHWLNRPRELAWDRLYRAGRAGGALNPGEFLGAGFYEIADTSAPWRDYVVRRQGGEAPGTARSAAPDVADVIGGMLSGWRRGVVRSLATAVSDTMAAREQSKTLVMRTLHLFRRLVPPVSADLGVPGPSWPYLTIGELTGLPHRPGLADRAGPRIEACARALSVAMPECLDLSGDGGERKPWESEAGRTPTGVAPGLASGVVVGPQDDMPAEPCVLVCASADADVRPLLPYVEGVLTERGSALSHIAILAREYGVPCVVGYAGATKLPRGTAVSINGTTGGVSVHDR